MSLYLSLLGLIAGAVLTLVPCQSASVKVLKLRDGQHERLACASDWSNANTEVICRLLGLNNGYFVAMTRKHSKWEKIPISTYTWNCHGWEGELSECPKTRRQSSCNTFVAFNCTGSSLFRSRSVIHSDFGNNISDHGFILTMESNKTDWTICSEQNTDKQALVKTLTVACRQLRYTSLSMFEIVNRREISPYFIEVYPCLPRIWTCLGSENNLSECARQSVPNLSWILYVQCSYSETPKEGDVRFMSNHPYSGYVELFHNSLWGKLCPIDNINNLQTTVCKQLHLGPFVQTYQREDNQPFGHIHDFILSCKGNETNLAQCQRRKNHEVCSWRYTLYVTCLYTPTLSIRLYPISSNQTAAQVLLMNTWSFIGWDYTWTLSEAAVVCGMLNQGPPEYFYSTHLYQKAPHLNFHPHCSGTEDSLLECDLKIEYVIYRAYADVVVIKCAQLSRKENGIMLSKDSAWSEFVFISRDFHWHIVCGCKGIWSSRSAEVICREMGFSDGYQLSANANGVMNRYGPAVKLTCSSEDVADLSECSITPCDTQTCSQAAKVTCSNNSMTNNYTPRYARNLAGPYLYFIPFGIVIFAIVCLYKKVRIARNATNQIVTASMTEAIPMHGTTLDPTEVDLLPPSYNAFITNPEMYPAVADTDKDLPPYPGMLVESSSNETSSV